jgi:hypothetical protein
VEIIATSRHLKSLGGMLTGDVRLRVYTNPLSPIRGMGNAIRVEPVDFRGAPITYATISAFLDAWDIKGSKRRNIRVPFLKRVHPLGNLAGYWFSRFGIYPTPNCGCPDRKEWWNFLFAFTPLGWKSVEEIE